VRVHCDIHKYSYNIINITYLNSPPQKRFLKDEEEYGILRSPRLPKWVK
jgi:hypothetical protein